MCLNELFEAKLPILKIYPFSATDGRGNRFAVYLAGCNLNCKICHNPESINLCNFNLDCINVCTTNSIVYQNNMIVYNYDSCILCDACIKACNNNSSPRYLYRSGKQLVDEIVAKKDFISGVTFSGGEATIHHKILKDVLMMLKEKNVEIYIDSNGYFEPSKEYLQFEQYVDKYMIDLKFFNSELHTMHTSKQNDLIIANIKRLFHIGKLEEVRTVLFDNNIDDISNIISIIPPNTMYKIIPYHKYGVRKKYKDEFKVPTQSTIKKLKKVLNASNVKYDILKY